MTKIIGISLVKNEDLYVERAIENAIDFCDELIVLDNNSHDNTWNILYDLSQKYDKISLRKWKNHRDSHIVLNQYIGRDHWIFAVDGDEIYDPDGLKELKPRVLRGEYNDYFNIKGHALHCSLNDYPFFHGYMDGSKSICKLYNFSILKSWNQWERLHGGTPKLKNNLECKTLNIRENSWDDSLFRCLHMCFVRRSSLDSDDDPRSPPAGHNPNIKNLKYKKGKLLKLRADFYEKS